MQFQQQTAHELYQRIAFVHASPSWACFDEVADGTGRNCNRHCDALAMSLWPSRGLFIRGFEIKVSRSDYKNELGNPEKAEAVARFCDEWYIVAPDGLVKDITTELPPAWGLMVPNKGKGLTTVRAAKFVKGKTVTRSFLAAVFRSAQRSVADVLKHHVPRSEIEEQLEKSYQRGLDGGPGYRNELRKELDGANKALKEFEEHTGIKIMGYDQWDELEHLGLKVKLGGIILGKYGSGPIEQALRSVDQAMSSLKMAHEELVELGKEDPQHKLPDLGEL